MEIDVIRTREGFLKLEQEWERLSRQKRGEVFYMSFDWFYSLICLADDAPKDLYIITVRSADELIGVLPCTVVHRKHRLFGLRSLELIGNVYSPIRGGLAKLGRENEVAAGVADFLLTDRYRDWDVLTLEAVSNGDPFLPRLMSALEVRGLRSRTVDQFANVITDVSGISTAEQYYKMLSKNHRKSIRSAMNRMNAEGSFDVVLVQNAHQDMQRAMDDYYQIYSQSWKGNEGDPHFHRNLAARLAQRGSLRLFLLYFRAGRSDHDGSKTPSRTNSHQDLIRPHAQIPDGYLPIAAEFVVVSGTSAYFLKSAYREDHAQYSAGTALFWLAIKHLVEVDGVAVLDYQKGDEPYKLRWGKVRETRIQYQAANPGAARARLELWAERHVIPVLRKVTRPRKPTCEPRVCNIWLGWELSECVGVLHSIC